MPIIPSSGYEIVTGQTDTSGDPVELEAPPNMVGVWAYATYAFFARAGIISYDTTIKLTKDRTIPGNFPNNATGIDTATFTPVSGAQEDAVNVHLVCVPW